jgi:hypothetical protein
MFPALGVGAMWLYLCLFGSVQWAGQEWPISWQWPDTPATQLGQICTELIGCDQITFNQYMSLYTIPPFMEYVLRNVYIYSPAPSEWQICAPEKLVESVLLIYSVGYRISFVRLYSSPRHKYSRDKCGNQLLVGPSQCATENPVALYLVVSPSCRVSHPTNWRGAQKNSS